MSETTVLILDRDALQSEFLIRSFEEKGISVKASERLAPIINELNPETNHFLLLEYQTLAIEKRETVIDLFRRLQIDRALVYNVPSDASRRVAFYELGALRVYDQNLTIEEVFRNALWWFNQFNLKPERKETDLQGDLNFVDLEQLIAGIAQSKSQGILEITSGRSHGHVHFLEGQIIHASVFNHVGLDALLHISLWEKGSFAFRLTDQSQTPRSIYLSLPGILILLKELKEDLAPVFAQFKSDLSVVQAIHLGDLPLYDLQLDQNFVQYISTPRELGEVLENPFYTNHRTLTILADLKRFGLLRVNEPIDSILQNEKPLLENIYKDKDLIKHFDLELEKIDQLVERLDPGKDSHLKIVVISDDENLFKHYLGTLVDSPDRVVFEENMYLVQFALNSHVEIILIGMRANHYLLRLLSVISEQIHGFVFLINGGRIGNAGYFSYLINQTLSQRAVPAVCAVTYLNDETDLEKVRKQFFLSWKIDWQTFASNNAEEMLEILFQLAPVEAIEVEKEEEQAEEEES